MKKIKDKKIFLKKISLSICLALLIMLIDINSTTVNATNNQLPNQPSFEVKLNSAIPNPALIGEDITINGTVTPKPFETEVKSQKKEIVLVLDVSRSMNEEVDAKCTNPRGRVEVSWDEAYHLNHKGINVIRENDHYYVEDYCKEHGEIGEHNSTKITELKKAANNFIDKMKSVSDLKIGIVTYSTNANINKGTYQDGFLDDSDTLHNIVNNLTADGGTNTGEGLRKAEYMIENGDSDAKKSIVFMSDGEPTFYSIKEKYGGYYESYYDYYTSIDTTDPSHGGRGDSDDQGYCKEYAKKIGSIIKENKSNVFSVGYGLDSYGNETMKDIHESMGGISDDKHFFVTDAGAIDGVFSGIADQIIKSYTVDSLAMNMNFNSNDGFSLNIGGNTVKLDKIVYNKVENSEANGKWKYEAAAVPFSFIIKGSKIGEYNNVFKNSTATFSWEGNIISGLVDQNGLTIIIKDNELPNIEATLESVTPNPANPSDNIEVKYKIDTQPFQYNGGNLNSGAIDDVVFVVDLSDKMDTGQRYTNFKNSFYNSILDGSILGDRDIKFNAVGYSESVKFPNGNNDYDTLIGRKSEREKLRLVFEDKLHPDNSKKRNIEKALDRANELLQETSEHGKNKAIILATSGDADYDPNSDIIKTISKKGYKIISLDMSNTDGSENANLKKLHHLLSGQDEDYLIAGSDGGQYNQPEKMYMNDIAEKLLKGIATTSNLSISNVVLNFDLGENFKAKEDGRLGGSGKIRTVTIPKIEYTKDTSGNNVWTQKPVEITFGINSEDGKYGRLGFGSKENNTLKYTKFNNSIFSKEIDTPVVEVRSPIVKHGIYTGINQPIDEDVISKKFSNGSKVTLAASFMAYDNESTATLNVPGGTVDNIAVYKNGELIKLESDSSVAAKKVDEHNYTFTFKDVLQEGEKILIVYNETLPTASGYYNNTMTVDPQRSKIATVNVVNEALPDLF